MLKPIPHSQLADHWNDTAPFLRAALARSNGRYDERSVAQSLVNRDMQLWAAIQDGRIVSAAATQIAVYPTGLRSCLFLLGGGDGAAILENEAPVLGWAREQGCTLAELIGRRGWVRRLPEWENELVILERKL